MIVILGLCFLLTDLLSLEEGVSFEVGCPKSRMRNKFGRRWAREWRVLKIGQLPWMSFVYRPL